MKILIAEDDLTSQNILATLLRKYGHEVTVTENGAKAWEIMQRIDAPQLLVLDWIMPEMLGDELCRRIRSLEAEIPPYIILLTVKSEKPDIIAGLEAGADDYLSKPYDPDELYARIRVGQRILELQNARELLLHEVHHRIKNNMNTIYGLLVLQAEMLEDPLAVNALKDASKRVQSMTMLYGKLYQSANYKEMSVVYYLPALIDEISAGFDHTGKITIEKDIEDFVLPAKKLQPLGIIINELLTNIMKYAFTGRQVGTVTISATKNENHITFIVADNGVGIPEAVNFETSPGFGLMLVRELTRQLNGTIRIERSGGTRIILEMDN